MSKLITSETTNPTTTDTHPAAQAILLEGYRRMSAETKLKLALEMSQAVMELAQIGIDRRYPGIDAAEKRLRLAALFWGRELSLRINGWDPVKEGY